MLLRLAALVVLASLSGSIDMARYQIPDGNIIIAEADFIAAVYPTAVLLPDLPQTDQPAEWIIDVGAFFDRFGVQKYQVLLDPDPMIKAFILDASVRRNGIDLKYRVADIAAALDYLASKGYILDKANLLAKPNDAERFRG